MPVLGLALSNPLLELGLTGGALAISGAAILLGRAHGSGSRPLLLFLAGAALLGAAIATDGFSQLLHIALILGGASFIVSAHVLNGRAGARRETTCCPHDGAH
jgi:hypothetical protein